MHHLSVEDADELAEYFLRHMTQDQRSRLMAERPVLYASVFPGVSADTIIGHVSGMLRARDLIQGR